MTPPEKIEEYILRVRETLWQETEGKKMLWRRH
jgi:hypothetical protein